MTATDPAETVVQTVTLQCGHHMRYRIWRTLAESGFARPGVRWRCTHCDPVGDTKLPITSVHNAPVNATTA